MPLQAFCHEQAAEQLLSADAMLAACPHLESAHCARVEVPLSLLHGFAAPESVLHKLPLYFPLCAMGKCGPSKTGTIHLFKPDRQTLNCVLRFAMSAGAHTMQSVGGCK